MVTVRQTITRALRKLRVVASGDEPTAAEAADGLAAVQGMFDQWASSGMFGRLSQYFGDAQGVTFNTDENGREVVLWEAPPSDPTVELPIRVRDSFTGDLRPPAHLSFTEIVDEATGTRKTFLYDARKAQWVRLDNLALESEMPLAGSGAEGIAAALAMRIAEEFGAEPGPMLAREASRFTFALSARYGEERRTGTSVYF